jgi:zinc/manganese transport system substrate-binding protein
LRESNACGGKVLSNGVFEILHYPASTDSVSLIIGIILIMCKESRVKRIAPVVAVAALALLTLGACSSSGEEDGSIRVVATTSILGDLAQNVIGDAGEVVVLMPIGVNPHDFQPSAQQVAAIQKADLVIANGLGLEEGLSDVLEAATSDGVRVWEVGPDINPRLFAEAPDTDEHDEGLLDPHFWLDPLKDVETARLLAGQLAEIDPDRDWSAGAEAYVAELERVHEESIEMLAVVADADRKLVTNHRAFGYFSDRYDFDMIGTVIPGGATLANPSSSELASLVETIERQQVPAIFTETVESDTLARTVAAEVGYDIEIVELYTGSLGEPGTEWDTLAGLLRANARRIADALGSG